MASHYNKHSFIPFIIFFFLNNTTKAYSFVFLYNKKMTNLLIVLHFSSLIAEPCVLKLKKLD